MQDIESCYAGRTVLVTGHSGFTGTWLSMWLVHLGARVVGMSLPPNTKPSVFEETSISSRIESHFADIRSREAVSEVFSRAKPDLVLHLAAQPIVSEGYRDPHGTFETNVMGTLNVLDVASQTDGVAGAVCVTTDKVYQNREWVWGYRETDPLGGTDPYSASKTASEAVIHTYRDTLMPIRNGMQVSAARGGNIIGGGDWSKDRIVVDFVKSATDGTPLVLRNPSATRPWQHVLALVHGYLLLGANMLAGKSDIANDNWNFGPGEDGNRSVGELVDALHDSWPVASVEHQDSTMKESHFLFLASDKARQQLGWSPCLSFGEAVSWTASWYKAYYEGRSANELMSEQISEYRGRLSSG